jgi:divalent metal cation (Fe/Co/Zn/Cd) transporter
VGLSAESPIPAEKSAETDRLYRLAIRLEYLTLAWMVVEAVVALAAGLAARSVALEGFGLDSLIELAASATVLVRLKRRGELEPRADRGAARIVGVTFFALGAYVGFTSVRSLALQHAPEFSWPGTILAAAALVAMPALGLAKRAVGRRLGSRALVTESMETFFCAWFSAALLAGLALNGWLGWWWADSAAALVMAVLMVREGAEAFEKGGGES